MMNRRRLFLTHSLTLLGSVFLPRSAWAFRPSAKWVLSKASGIRYRLGIRSLKIEASVERFDLDERGTSAEEKIWVMSPSSLRRETTRPDGMDLFLMTSSKKYVHFGKNKSTQKRRSDFLVDFLTMGEPMQRASANARLAKALSALHIDEKVVSYGRHDGKVMYIIGCKSFEIGKPSVWFDKDTLQLSRIVERLKGADGKTRVRETRLLGYGSPEGGAWWPKTIEVLVDGKLMKRSSISRVEKNPTMKKSVFALPK